MALIGVALTMGSMWAAYKIMDWMGGDPEAAVAGLEARRQGLTALQQRMPEHRMRQRLDAEEERQGALSRDMADFEVEAREVSLGHGVTGSRELLESVSERLGITPEDLGRRLSPMRKGDYSSVSKAAFGRSTKEMK